MKCSSWFSDYILGVWELVIICIIPAVTPIILFFKYDEGVMPYILLLFAMAGIFYEFSGEKSEELNNRLKREKFAIIITTAIFATMDIICLLIHLELGIAYNIQDYCILGYIITPTVISIIEIIYVYRSTLNKTKKNKKKEIPNQTKNSENRIAKGGAKEI